MRLANGDEQAGSVEAKRGALCLAGGDGGDLGRGLAGVGNLQRHGMPVDQGDSGRLAPRELHRETKTEAGIGHA